MKQVLQDLRSGVTQIADVPAPVVSPNRVLIQTRASLISAGTERMLVEFGKASFIGKARAQPDKVKQVLDKIRADGVLPTLDAVFKKLDEPIPLGYCNAGVVLGVGPGVQGLRVGDRVISNGPHAELVTVPGNLCARIPDGVSDEQAAFTVLAAIGLQGVRLVQPTLGERVVVYGLGLIGLVTVQILRAAGCEVLGIDLDPRRLELAERMGARVASGAGNVLPAAEGWCDGEGVDAVIITASAKTDEIVHNAAQMCRKRGRIVLVGVVGLNLRRSDFYEKELSFQVSCSYGPGRYDERYEQQGQDYPAGFVRWTEQRNFAAVLELLRGGGLKVDELISDRIPLDRAETAYSKVSDDPSALGIVLEYPHEVQLATRVDLPSARAAAAGAATVGVIGAGNFSKMSLVPNLARTPAEIRYVCDLDGAAAASLAKRGGSVSAVTDYRQLLDDKSVNTLVIAVGHDLHGRFIREGLQAGKHVFVEKPLATTLEDLAQTVACARAHSNQLLMVGFNRRFSPHVVRMKKLLARRAEPLAMNMTINAGIIPPDHWVHDPVRGGGRIIGEACHFIDLLSHITGSPVATVSAAMMGPGPVIREDKMCINLTFEDGSIGNVNYFGNGVKSYPKEMLEVFSEGRVLRIVNFRKLEAHGVRQFNLKDQLGLSQDKGHLAELEAFVAAITTGGPSPIPLTEQVNSTLASFAALSAAAETRTVVMDQEYRALLG